MYGLQELSTVVLTQLVALQLQFKMEFRFSHDHFVSFFFFCTNSTIIIILAHICFYPCLSEMFFKNYLFCNKLRRSVQFQHAINPSSPDLFQCKPLRFRLSFSLSHAWSAQEGHTETAWTWAIMIQVRTLTLHCSSALAVSKRTKAQCRSVEHYSCLMTKFLVWRSTCLFHWLANRRCPCVSQLWF